MSPEHVVSSLRHSWGDSPERGGEFFPDVFSEKFTRLGIRPHSKPQRSPAFPVEEMHGPVWSALLKIREENAPRDMDRVLIDVLEVINNSLGAGGFSLN